MFLKRWGIAAAASAAVVTMSAAPGHAATGGHLWNDSPSVNLCLSVSYAPVDYVGADMEPCQATPYESWSFTGLHSVGVVNGYYLEDGYGQCLQGWGRGAEITVAACNSGDANQLWNAGYYRTDGGYRYYEVGNSETGYCLSVSGGSTAEFAVAIIWTCQHTLDQQWGGPGSSGM